MASVFYLLTEIHVGQSCMIERDFAAQQYSLSERFGRHVLLSGIFLEMMIEMKPDQEEINKDQEQR